MTGAGKVLMVACRLMAEVSEHFRVTLEPGDLRTMKAKERKSHQTLRLVLAIASLICLTDDQLLLLAPVSG